MADHGHRSALDRRAFFALTGGSLLASTLSGCSKKEPAPPAVEAGPPAAAVPANAGVVRVASVKTAVEGNVLPELIADFGPRICLVVSASLCSIWSMRAASAARRSSRSASCSLSFSVSPRHLQSCLVANNHL